MKLLLGLLAALAAATAGWAQAPADTRVLPTRHKFEVLIKRAESAVERHGLGVVATASASRGAAARGVKIPGNAVVMVFRNDLAVRLIAANVAAGIEAPLRLYLTENAGGTSTLSYRLPSAVFAPYRHSEVDKLAAELEVMLARIAADALGS